MSSKKENKKTGVIQFDDFNRCFKHLIFMAHKYLFSRKKTLYVIMVNQKHVYVAPVFYISCLDKQSFEFSRVKEKWEILDCKGNEQA
jgi:hypothetical protein